MKNSLIIKYNKAIFDTDKKRAFEIIDGALTQGFSPEEIVFELIVPAIDNIIIGVSEK